MTSTSGIARWRLAGRSATVVCNRLIARSEARRLPRRRACRFRGSAQEDQTEHGERLAHQGQSWPASQRVIKTEGAPAAAKSSEMYDVGIEQTLIGTNTGATTMMWSNVLGAAAKASGQNLELLRMPKIEGATTGGMFLQPAMLYTASSRSQHAAEAAKFIDFMINDSEAGQIILSDRGLPANSKVLSAVSAKLPAADLKTMAFVNEIRGELTDPPAAPPKGSSAMEDLIRRYAEEVIFNRMTPHEAAQKFTTEANALLAG